MKRNVFLVTALAAGIALTGCNVADQDGDGTDSRVGLNGLAVDGRVAGGKVWVDSNNNYEVDDFEPYAFTDSDGYYSYNPLTNTNYCTLPVISDEYQRHCLVYGSTVNSMIVRIKGGIDLSTGERLKGLMAMSSSISESAEISMTPLVLSPITTLLSAAPTESAQNSIRSALGITSNADLRLDFSTASDDTSKRFLANAVAVQTMIDVLANSADDGITEAQAQRSIIDQISLSVSTNLTAPTSFNSATLAEMVSTVSTNSTKQTSIASRLEALNSEINKISTAINLDEVNANLKAAEVISQLVKSEANAEHSSEASAAAAVLDSGMTDLVGLLETQFSSDTTTEFDITSITRELIEAGEDDPTFGSDISAVINSAIDESVLSTETSWGGEWFVLQPSEEYAEDVAAGSYVALYLEGDVDSKSGSISVCVNAAAADSTDANEALTNEYMTGSWTKISDGVVTLVIDFEGQEFEGTMKAKDSTDANGNPFFRFSTDIEDIDEDGDAISNQVGVIAISYSDVPDSSDDCESDIDAELSLVL
ncbi:hypothetical protein [Reinekea marinisedimentorum]|uniref:Uncharacterized protein n=1 Tax=Reinekea marinisedimentorum TaxID=230495 RepID=A0A4R3HY72_9GAMM|nr:hypothetical protein [Reinekea marinisedimentorum]TCS38138.1 hypothetical protein BCF53_11766 [Reinekea marinisedimentorum]